MGLKFRNHVLLELIEIKISQGDQLEFWQRFKWSLCTIENGEN
jgi:hypothetical protein